jgi:glutamate/tyrosine decarboxylase-like PLP-dependent enzyme
VARGEPLGRAFAPLATDLDRLLAKWALLARPASSDETATPVATATHAAPTPPATAPTSLDPVDWAAFRAEAIRALDGMIEHLSDHRSRPVWQPMPPNVRQSFTAPLPTAPQPLATVLDDVATRITPYVTGNTHPMFMGWVHGAGTPVGMVAEMIAGGLNANCGGRDHVGLEVERQVTRWAAEMLGFPDDSSGVLVTGTSMANFLAVLVARDAALGHEVRRWGLTRTGRELVAYTSAEAHGCIAQAMELAGLGSDNLRRMPVDSLGRLDHGRLATVIATDRAAGLVPFLIVGTAGTVNTGAIDDLAALADIADRDRLWFHVDGAFGALAALSPTLKPLLAGIERARSVAFDFHKWGQVPYDAGFLLVRDADAHRGTFASPAAYLSRLPRGLAAGDTWPCDLGPDLSRGFRALKAWMTLKVHGTDALASSIERTCTIARHLAGQVEASPILELRAPVALNIVCFGLKDAASDILVPEIVMDLHERGVAAPSMTMLSGRPAIRCAIVNHRTTQADAERLLAEVAVSLASIRARMTPAS